MWSLLVKSHRQSNLSIRTKPVSLIVSLSGTPIPFNKYRNITNSTHQSTRIIR